jgi:hypothetical protein
MFTARDQAFRFRRGQEGFSGLVFGSDNAERDHAAFRADGLSGGPMLTFSRMMTFPDGSSLEATFKLAFAADLRAPDFVFVTCERINVIPFDRSSLEVHPNGVTGIASVILYEPDPVDLQLIIEQSAATSAQRTADGLLLMTGASRIEVLTAAGFKNQFGHKIACHARGWRGKAIVFRVADISVTETLFETQGIDYRLCDSRLIVEPDAGQGAIFAFEEMT